MDYLFSFYFFAAIAVGMVAHAKSRSGIGWGLSALLISPPMAALLLIVMSLPSDHDQASEKTHVRCPDCRELIRRDATVCAHCGCKLTANAT